MPTFLEATENLDHGNMAAYFNELRRIVERERKLNIAVLKGPAAASILDVINAQFETCFVSGGSFDLNAFVRMNEKEETNLHIAVMTNMRGTSHRKAHCMLIIDFGTFSIRYSNIDPPAKVEVLE